MEINSIAFERAGSILLGTAFFIIGFGFTALGVTWLPVIGLLFALPFFLLAFSIPKLTDRGRPIRITAGSALVNYINNFGPRRKRVIPVTILSTPRIQGSADFDASRIEPSSVRFGPNEIAPEQAPVKLPAAWTHYDEGTGGGDKDLVFYFSEEDAGVTPETREVCVSGRTTDGESFFGCTVYRSNA